MAKRRSYKRRGSRHKDSTYKRGENQNLYEDEQFSQNMSERLIDSESKLEGPGMPLDRLMMTKRGKRIHISDGEVSMDKKTWHTISALCGAGRPNKEFPQGSSIPLEAKLSKNLSSSQVQEYKRAEEEEDYVFQATCYRCIKLQYMRDVSGYEDQDGKPIELVTRDFFPTNKDNRSKHVMVPAGRGGYFGSNRYGIINENEDGQLINYYLYFDESEWVPGIEEQRTQPASLAFIGNRTPTEVLKILEFQSKKEMFGVLIRNVLGTRLYDALEPVGNATDSNTAYDKLLNLVLLRRVLAQQAFDRASARGKASRNNPLIGMSDDLLDGIELFVRRNHVRSRR